MIQYRPFLNTDPPRLAEIWRGSSGRRGLAQPMTATMIEQLVLAKPYFDRGGLTLALDDGRPVGFVHAGFGPNQDESGLDRDWGVTVLLLVVPHPQQADIMRELLARSEAYLKSGGAKVLYGGAIRPLTPFYWGLYGGSELPGILDSDADLQALFLASSYKQVERTLVFHRPLSGFRPTVDRLQMQIRRGTELQVIEEPAADNWWDACSMHSYDLTRFQLRERGSKTLLAQATFWSMTPYSNLRVQAQGLLNIDVAADQRRKSYAIYLLGEAMRQFSEQGFGLIEAQTNERNVAAVSLYRKLGFEQVDAGAVYRKEQEVRGEG